MLQPIAGRPSGAEAPASAFRGPFQPARRPFGIDGVVRGGRRIAVRQRDVLRRPFCTLVRFETELSHDAPRILIVPPLSGHFAFLMRDVVAGLLPDHDVHVADWTNARHVPPVAGRFGFDDNIACVIAFLRAVGPATVLALCQGGVPALAATALLSEDADPATPRGLVLMAAPIDPLANPTRVVRLLRQRPISWFESNVLATVPPGDPGAGRLVYPASIQFAGLLTYLSRQLGAQDELYDILTRDEGTDPQGHPFLDLYASVMDLPAEVFLENIRLVFHDRALARGRLRAAGRVVDCGAIASTGLMTVEGELDDIAAPGQTLAAQAFCTAVPGAKRLCLELAGAGHFSTFYGSGFRDGVLPRIRDFVRSL